MPSAHTVARRHVAMAVALALALTVTGWRLVESAVHGGRSSAPLRPNVVVIVADDLDAKLLPWMPNVMHLLADQGATFTHYYVEQSLCCPSRATMLSGRYSHNTGVQSNHWPDGGFFRWRGHDERHALPTWLAANGYRNAEIGKYLNEYPFPARRPFSAAQKARLRTYVPPGWSSWFSPVAGNPYRQVRTVLNVDGVVDPKPRRAYLDQILGDRLLALAAGADGMGLDKGGRFVYYASYSPHQPYAAPARLDDRFTQVRYPHAPDFNEPNVSDKFGEARTRPLLTAVRSHHIDADFQQRIRSVQVLDATVGRLVHRLESEGLLDSTYIVFTSDNGYHMGEHRLGVNKYSQYQEDVNVPLIVRGPGIAPATRIDALAGNVDLAPTIADLTGTPIPGDVDGLSLVPLLTGATTSLPRHHLLISRGSVPLERHQASGVEEFPERDVGSRALAQSSDFRGVVTEEWKLVEYTHSHHMELYHLTSDPFELHNLLAGGRAALDRMVPARRALVRGLEASIARLSHCGASGCRF